MKRLKELTYIWAGEGNTADMYDPKNWKDGKAPSRPPSWLKRLWFKVVRKNVPVTIDVLWFPDR